VRLGVNAPKSVSVQREEIFHRIKHESAQTAQSEHRTEETTPAS
jgi:carbon storage regulator CsrA